MNEKPSILISLKPRHADDVLAGQKTVELRKRRPNIEAGTEMWIYATSPVAAIKGRAVVDRIESRSPTELWKQLGKLTGISKIEFDDYFMGRAVGHALILNDIVRLARPLSLETIRETVEGFHPPQFFLHLNGAGTRLRLNSRKIIPVPGTVGARQSS